jgi:ribosomal protein S18 acetylase RimI-like enzyme
MDYSIREMTIGDYDEVYRLREQTEGLNLEERDSREGIDIYLRRNQGLRSVAYANSHIVATVLCGHEDRRGILHHLAFKREHRGKGVARALINHCLSALAKDGIKKCNTFVLDENVEGGLFWEQMGWYVLGDNYRTMQTPTAQDK